MNSKSVLRAFLCISFLLCFQESFGQKVANPIIMISFDGMRMDKLDEYMQNNPESNFRKFIENGIRAKNMQASFPSSTFPNHWAIATGVYPGFSGVVGNTIYDPSADLKVNLLRDAVKGQERWWNISDPIWVSAKNNKLKTGAFFWPGSDIDTRNPDIWLSYNESYPFEERIDTIIKWQLEQKLDITCGYFNEPDSSGHAYGPDSQEYMTAIARMDGIVGYFMKKIADNNLSHINIILVSDHGMATVKDVIYIGKYVNMPDVDLNRTDLYMVSNIHPKPNADKEAFYNALKTIPFVDVYKKEDVPAKFSYKASDRIAPFVVVANEGYYLTSNPNAKANAGGHGYDPSIPSMAAMFLAQGPAFKKKVVLDTFENVNVKPLLCGLLKIKCPNTNGTILKFQAGVVDQSLFNSAGSTSFNTITLLSIVLFTKLFFSF